MAVAVTWPATLPPPLTNGLGIEPGDGILRTEMESGPARQEEIFTGVPEKVQLKWVFDAWEYAVFKAWYKWRAHQGATWFGIDLPAGIGIIPHEARFVGQPREQLLGGGTWEVSAQIEVRDPPSLTEQELEIAEVEPLAGLIDAAGTLHAAVGVSLPATLT